MPGSVLLLVMGIAAGAVLLSVPRTRDWGRRWILAFAATYWLLSLPAFADGLADALGGGLRPLHAAELRGVDAIVVLEGGYDRYAHGGVVLEHPRETANLRAVEAARIARIAHDAVVIVTGGAAVPLDGRVPGRSLAEAVGRAGVPAERVVLDPESSNTRAHVVNVGRILRERGASQFVVVTSVTHIRRALAAFRRDGFQPLASPAPVRSSHIHLSRWRRWLPHEESLQISEQAIYDAFGLAYYWMRGWI